MRNSMFKKLIIVPLIWLAAGILCIVIATTLYTIPDYYVDGTASITSIDEYYNGSDTEYTVMVEYKVDGKTYQSKLGSYASNYEVGKELKIKYDPENPENICDASRLPKIVFMGFGIISILAAILKVFRTLVRGR